MVTKPIAKDQEVVDYVESAPRTCGDVAMRFAGDKRQLRHLGYRINTGDWSVDGVSPNFTGPGRTGDSANDAKHTVLADLCYQLHSGKTIKVVKSATERRKK